MLERIVKVLFGGKGSSVNVKMVANKMRERNWNVVSVKDDCIVVGITYYNKRVKHQELKLKFKENDVTFIDGRNYDISQVSLNKMYPEMMDICNVI